MSIAARQQAAQKIMAQPSHFKVCECCGSIVTRKVTVCPNCNAYRFDLSVESVARQAEILANREPLSIEASDYD